MAMGRLKVRLFVLIASAPNYKYCILSTYFLALRIWWLSYLLPSMRQLTQSTRCAGSLLCRKYALAVSNFAFPVEFYWKGTGVLFFNRQFQEDGYFCKKYFISVFSLVMAPSAVVVNLVSLFDLSDCFCSTNFLVKFSVVNVSRKNWCKLKIKFLLHIAVINWQIETAAIIHYHLGFKNKIKVFFFLLYMILKVCEIVFQPL